MPPDQKLHQTVKFRTMKWSFFFLIFATSIDNFIYLTHHPGESESIGVNDFQILSRQNQQNSSRLQYFNGFMVRK